jgi:hypothetical protein
VGTAEQRDKFFLARTLGVLIGRRADPSRQPAVTPESAEKKTNFFHRSRSMSSVTGAEQPAWLRAALRASIRADDLLSLSVKINVLNSPVCLMTPGADMVVETAAIPLATFFGGRQAQIQTFAR